MFNRRKILKTFFRIFIVIIALLLLLIFLLNLPFVQSYLSQRAAAYLSKKTNTEVSIDGVYFRLPNKVALKSLYVEDLYKDTLLYSKELNINISLPKLLKKQVVINSVGLNTIKVDAHPNQDGMNFQFLVDAFSSPNDAVEKETSTKKSNKKPWAIVFPDTKIDLTSIDLNYATNAQTYNIQLGQLGLDVDDIQLTENVIRLDELKLVDTDLSLAFSEQEEKDTTQSGGGTTPLILFCEKLSLSDISFQFQTDSMAIAADVGILEADSVDFTMEESIDIDIPTFKLSESRFQLDQGISPPIKGFDPAHFIIQDIHLEISDFTYHDLDIYATIDSLSALEPKGAKVENLTASVHYNLDTAEVEDLLLRTNQSIIKANNTLVTFPFVRQGGELGDMELQSNIKRSVVHPDDVVFFAPMLEDMYFFQNNKNNKVAFNGVVTGTLDDLRINTIDVNGWNSHFNGQGRLLKVLDQNQTYFNFEANVIELDEAGLKKWIPENTLPPYMSLPSSLFAKATLKGPYKALDFGLEATTTRPGIPIATKLKSTGVINNVLDFEDLSFKLNVDTLYTSKSDLLSIIPASALPDYLDFPPELILSGALDGNLDSIKTEFDLYSIRGGNFSFLNASGDVSGFSSGSTPNFDLTINELDLKAEEILAFLPKSLLPDFIVIPRIKNANGFIKGIKNTYTSDLSVDTDIGKIIVNGSLQDSLYNFKLDLSALDIEQLFTEEGYEQFIGTPLSELGINVDINGSGFDPDSNLMANFRVVIKPTDDIYDWKEGLVIEGAINRQSAVSKLYIDEYGAKAAATSYANYNPGQDTFAFDMNLDLLDFYRLRLTSLPFNVKGDLSTSIKGSEVDQLKVGVRMDDWTIQYDTLTERSDSLLLIADLDSNNNVIKLESDFIYGRINGKFKIAELATQIQDQITAYLTPDKDKISSDSLPETNFNALIELEKPEILTMGYIPGLKEIAPCFVLSSFDSKEQLLKIYSEIPSLKYSNFELLNLFFQFSADQEDLQYDINFSDIYLYNAYRIENISLIGDAQNGVLSNQLTQRDSSLTERFNLNAEVDLLPEKYIIRLKDDQLLNYNHWAINPKNAIHYQKEGIYAYDWDMSYEDQKIAIANEELTPDNIALTLSNFNLKFIADLIQLNSGIVEGITSGEVMANKVLEEPSFSVDLMTQNLGVLGAKLGDLKSKVDYSADQVADLDIGLVGFGNDLALNGIYKVDSLDEDLNFDLQINSTNLKNLEAALEPYLSLLTGDLKGQLKINGEVDEPKIIGNVNASNVTVRPNITQAILGINKAEINFTENGFSIPEFIITDSLNREATCSGEILTYNYRDFGLLFNFDAEDFLLLNTTREDNDLYFGKLTADLSTEIIGDFENPVITVDIKPERGSDITYIYSYGGIQSIESSDGIVEFISSRDTLEEDPRDKRLLQAVQTGYGYDISINAAVNDNLKITVITDEASNDRFIGQGNGDLAVRMLPNNDIEMTGGIRLTSGKYYFTYSEVIRREFDVKDGSSVNFEGNPYNPLLNVIAAYTTRTSPYGLIVSELGNDRQVSEDERKAWKSTYSKNETFVAEIGIRGPLKEIELGTEVKYPNTSNNTNSEDVKNALNSLNQDPSRTNTQAFSLILFNGFIAEDIGNGDGQLIDVNSGLSDLITSQLNNLANRYIKFVDLNFGVESAGSGSGNLFENSDFRVSLSKSFLDDRLTINVDGVATNDPEETSQAYLNNISLEYALTDEGVLKIKLFNKRENDDVFNGNVVKLGGALVFSKDFNQIKLFGKKNK
ncbi:MAG: translocation/assembly module TamB domain-containing protein [Bacteroidota bacterium]